MRLPTEAEYHRAAYGTPGGGERPYPWGEEPPDPSRGNFDFANPDPVPVGSFPAGASAWGIHDLLGNGWEWTSTVFSGFPGFTPMPSYPVYSTDFFDGKHYVLKGGSPVTAKELSGGVSATGSAETIRSLRDVPVREMRKIEVDPGADRIKSSIQSRTYGRFAEDLVARPLSRSEADPVEVSL
jgi:hypothetical protein